MFWHSAARVSLEHMDGATDSRGVQWPPSSAPIATGCAHATGASQHPAPAWVSSRAAADWRLSGGMSFAASRAAADASASSRIDGIALRTGDRMLLVRLIVADSPPGDPSTSSIGAKNVLGTDWNEMADCIEMRALSSVQDVRWLGIEHIEGALSRHAPPAGSP